MAVHRWPLSTTADEDVCTMAKPIRENPREKRGRSPWLNRRKEAWGREAPSLPKRQGVGDTISHTLSLLS
jgi:hypothetical protein